MPGTASEVAVGPMTIVTVPGTRPQLNELAFSACRTCDCSAAVPPWKT